MKIIADENIPFLKGVAEKLGEVEYISGTDFSNERIKSADALIIRTVAHMDEAMLKDTNVKLICTATIGYDHIDTRYCEEHGIKWKNAPGCNSSSVQQYIVSALLVLSHQKGFDLRNKTIGIIGVGNVGKKVAKACEILGMNVLLNDPPRQEIEINNDSFVSLDLIKERADIITFHAPLIRDGKFKTYHLADSTFFDTLGKKPIIINSARGAIIDTEAIKLAIKEEKITASIIDCWENEPSIDLEYLNMVDIATPHIAGYSADGKAKATRMALSALAGYFKLDKTPIESIIPPAPADPIIDLNKLSQNKRIESAILATYNPLHDFDKLKSSPLLFKQLRNEYPLRREYPAYMVIGASDSERQLLNKFDFRLG